MRISRLRGNIGLCALFTVLMGCNRKPYEANEYQAPLTRPEPVAEGEYSDPAAATPPRVAPVNQETKLSDDRSAAQNSLSGKAIPCPPPGATPASATVGGKPGALAAADCPPDDSNASKSQLGTPSSDHENKMAP